MIASALLPAPTITAQMPAWLRFGHSPAIRRANEPAYSGNRRLSAISTPLAMATWVPDSQRQPQEDETDPAQTDVDETAESSRPASRPAISPKTRPRTITGGRF